MWAEEMRILYVALTRAKEKLIMTGVLPDRFIMRSGKDGVITAGAKSYFDWIIPALWSEEEEAALEDAPVCIFQYTGNDDEWNPGKTVSQSMHRRMAYMSSTESSPVPPGTTMAAPTATKPWSGVSETPVTTTSSALQQEKTGGPAHH